jgi:hypothetical protein
MLLKLHAIHQPGSLAFEIYVMITRVTVVDWLKPNGLIKSGIAPGVVAVSNQL